MSGFNVVRFTVKDGMDDKFLSENKKFIFDDPGFKRGNMIKTGDHNYCFIAEWESASDSMKMSRNADAIPGIARGRVTFQKVLSLDAPRFIDASSNDADMAFK